MKMLIALKTERPRLLWLAALSTLVLCVLTAWRDNSGLVIPVERGATPKQIAAIAPASLRAETTKGEQKQLLDRDPLPETTTDLFRLVSFQPPPPKAEPLPPPPPPPKPTAPAFPYTYFGRMVDINGNTITYLSRDDALIPIHPQQLLDNSYRIEAVTETQIVVTYVPLEEKIVIAVQSGK